MHGPEEGGPGLKTEVERRWGAGGQQEEEEEVHRKRRGKYCEEQQASGRRRDSHSWRGGRRRHEKTLPSTPTDPYREKEDISTKTLPPAGQQNMETLTCPRRSSHCDSTVSESPPTSKLTTTGPAADPHDWTNTTHTGTFLVHSEH